MVSAVSTAEHIAVVDDDELMRDAIEGLIESMGHKATTFESADQFLASHLRREVTCIVADIQMPGRSGLDLQAALVAEGVATPIIFVTALPREDARRRAIEGGSQCFLIKPFEAQDLVRCIEEALTHAGPRSDQG